MQYRVVKVGFETTDMLHATGVALGLAVVTDSAIQLVDQGWYYSLQCSKDLPVDQRFTMIDRLLALPTVDTLAAFVEEQESINVDIGQLDGILAVTFTSPGPHIISVADLLAKQRLNDAIVPAVFAKAHLAINRYKSYLARAVPSSINRLAALFADYAGDRPTIPHLGPTGHYGISIPMTVDPALSYAPRRQRSDGLITHKTNMTFLQPRFGSVWTLIGAIRLLRLQRVGGNLVNCYVPIAKSFMVTPDIMMPLLPRATIPADHALACQWVTQYQHCTSSDSHWDGLAYQVLQTQGTKQSISHDRGYLSYAWLFQVTHRVGDRIFQDWQTLLNAQYDQIPFEMEHLIDVLLRQNGESWMAHLRDVAYCNDQQSILYPHYSMHEVKAILQMMPGTERHPLRTILERKAGTYRFGCALRLLGRINPSVLRDLIDELTPIRSEDALVRVLARAAQECAMAEARSPFIIVPNDDDLAALLDDIDHYSAQTIAGLLIILSTLRYPPNEETQTETISAASHAETPPTVLGAELASEQPAKASKENQQEEAHA